MAFVTTTTADKHIGEVWVNDIIRAQEYSFEFTPRVNRKWKFMGHGDVYHVPRIGNIAVNTKTTGSGNQWVPEANTDTEQTLTINRWQVAGVEIEELTKVLANTDLKSEYQKRIGYALGRGVEVNLAALVASFSQNVGTLGQEVTYDNLLRAWQYLADGGTPASDECTFIFAPATIAGLLKQDIIINALYRSDGKRAIENATIGTILGAPVIQSNLTNGTAPNSDGTLFKRDVIALMMAQEPTVITEFIALDIAWIIGAHQIYGYTEVDRYAEAASNVTAGDDWAVWIKAIK